MASQMMESQGLSPSSYVSEDLCFPDGRQTELFWKTNSLHNYHGIKADGALRKAGVPSSLLDSQISLGSPTRRCLQYPDHYVNQDLWLNSTLSLPRALDRKIGVRSVLMADSASYSVEEERTNIMSSRCENSLFSSSLSDLFTRKLRFPVNSSPHGHSVGGATSNYKEEEPFESLEELEAQTIGNLLPDGDDLLVGVTDGLDNVGQQNAGDDIEDLDLFNSVGGMDLGEDVSPERKNSVYSGKLTTQLECHVTSTGGEDPIGERPTRTLSVRNINSSVRDSELCALFEKYGDIRTLYTACKHLGFVIISYYDIRAARNAMKALQNKPVGHRNLDIHFSISKDNLSEKDANQGTLVVFSLDSSVSNDELREIFGVYGEIMEIRETPRRRYQKFVEFYDVRAAESALQALNRSDIGGKRIKVEASCPSDTRWLIQSFHSELEQGAHLHDGSAISVDNGSTLRTQSASGASASSYIDNGFDHGISFGLPNSLPSLVSLEAMGNRSSVGESGISPGQVRFDYRGTPSRLPHSGRQYHDLLSNTDFSNHMGGMSSAINIGQSETKENWKYCKVRPDGHSVELNEVFGPSGCGSCPNLGNHYMWSNLHQPQPQGMMWPNSQSFVSGVSTAHPQQLRPVPGGPSHMLSTLLPLTDHHMGSAPSINHTLWDRRHPYAGESPAASVLRPGSLGSTRISGNTSYASEFVPNNIFPWSGTSIDLPMSSQNIGLHHRHPKCMIFPRRDQIIPMTNSFDSSNERTRSRRNEGSSSQTDSKKQFELDIDKIARGDDKRTTLMIKNIPNKYTSKMLLAAIDERQRGTYDFIYLPIDFKNKCNVGYAFINMIDPSLIIPFYQVFNGKKWEKFNSEKVASLAYARIQGKAALVAHFQNSSLMNEDKRCRPILFHTDGPNAGDQVPFPMGVSIRLRTSKNRVCDSEDNNQESQPSSTTGEESLNGESSSGCVTESN